MGSISIRTRSILPHFIAVGVALAFANSASAITYVGVTAGPGGNTVRISDGDPSAWTNSPTMVPNTRVNTDNQWGLPPATQSNTLGGVPGFIHWEAAGASEDAPAIRTTVAGLPQGDYDVFFVYAGIVTPEWDIKAKLSTEQSFTLYTRTNGVLEHTNPDAHQARRAYVGTVRDATGFSVDVDDTRLAGESTDRSRYLAVAYEAVGVKHPGTDYPTTVANSSPVAYWRLNETAGPTAFDSIGGNHGTYNGNPALGQPGPQPLAFPGLPDNLAPRFDGGDFVQAGPVSFGSSAYSVELFFQISAANITTGNQDLFSASAGGSHGILLEVAEVTGGKERLRFLHRSPLGNVGGQDIFFFLPEDDADPFYSQIHHLVATKTDGTDGMILYLDGVAVGFNTANGGFNTPLDVLIGRLLPGNAARDFNGLLDEVAIYDRALSPQEVRQHFIAATQSIPEPATAGMLALGSLALLRRRRAA